jgi:membrane associated rhomboid family serine protease
MIPIRDQIKPRRVPVVNTLLIIINILVFAYQWLMTERAEQHPGFSIRLYPGEFPGCTHRPRQHS